MNTLKIGLHLLILIALCGACSKVAPPAVNIDLSDLSGLPRVTIDDYTDNIQYIPLQTKDQCYIRRVSKACFTDSCIILSNLTRQLLCFDYQGKFIRQIGHKGRGPGEFNSILDFDYNTSDGNIYILADKNILVYDISGTFHKSFDISSHNPATIAALGNTIIIHNNNFAGDNPFRFFLYDTNGNLLRKVDNPYQFEMNKQHIFTVFHECIFYKSDNHLRFKESLSDTIFTFSKEAFTPFICTNFGKASLTPKVRGSDEYFNNSEKYVNVYKIFESDNYFFFRFSLEKESWLCSFNKDDQKVLLSPIKNKLPNGVDGGLGLNPEYFYSQKGNEYLAQFTESYQLKNHITSEVFKNSTPLYPEKKKELEQLANSLDENDNPVLMLVKLKE